MSNQTASQTQHTDTTPGLDSMFPFAFGLDMWMRMTRDQLGRVQAFYDELAEMESSAYERAKRTTHELGEMMDESVKYMSTLGSEWRTLTLEVTRRITSFVTK